MGIFDIFAQKNTLDIIKNTFRFLVTDFGFEIIKIETRENFKAKYFIVYRNENSKLQLEICGDTTWFHCEIRRLINGHPAKYSDKENCMGFESLALLESNNKYEHLDYYAGGTTGLKGVLKNTAKLFKRHPKLFTTDNWIDVKKIEKLQDDDFKEKFGELPDHSKRSFFAELKNQATKLLIDKGYKLLIDSDELSPFDASRMVHYLTFQTDDKLIKIKQADWRDDYFIYRIEINNNIIFEIDIRNQEISTVVEKILKELRRVVN